MAKPPRYRIHPAIGVARVGDAAADEFFLGPEVPDRFGRMGEPGTGKTVPPHKVGGRIRRQAQRFRVFEYTESGGVWTASREITADLADVVNLTWTVDLANRKASFFEFDGLSGSPLLPRQPKRVRRNEAQADRRKLRIVPGPRSIAGRAARGVEFRKGTSTNPAAEQWPDPAPSPALEYLGELRTDARGRLIVIGGAGVVAKQAGAPDIAQYANNDMWFDDVSDGPVNAVLRLRVGGGMTTVPVRGAWVLVGPPDFAPGIPPTVTLWDVLVDLAVRRIPLPEDEAVFGTGGALARLTAMAKDLGRGPSLSRYKPSFDEDVAPILRQAVLPGWVFEQLQGFHTAMGAGGLPAARWEALSDPATPNDARLAVFQRLRKPGTAGLGADNMPQLLGDDPYNNLRTKRWGLSLTTTQYAIMEAWAGGRFVKSARPPASLLTPVGPGMVTPDGMDRAAAQSVSGGAFYPGIEVGWQIREPELFAEPFRIKHGAPSKYVGDARGRTVVAGHFTRQMALPWIADFLQCKVEEQRVTKADWGWWPSQRPDAVYATTADALAAGTMVHWHRATVGASSDWPSDAHEPSPRSSDMPSYQQMVDNWTKLGFVVPGAGVFAETERGGAVP
ncbi:LodA/GoxA family CTQ-dependent oxidase [Saccharothrix stipae]